LLLREMASFESASVSEKTLSEPPLTTLQQVVEP
jgi:hypothetical protein